MNLKYKKKKIIGNLILGVLWVIFGVSAVLFTDEPVHWTNYGYIVMGLIYLGMYLYNHKFQYITIKDGIIKDHSFFGRTIKLEEITSFKKFAGDYIITAGKKELYINTELITPDSLVDLKEYFNSLKAKK